MKFVVNGSSHGFLGAFVKMMLAICKPVVVVKFVLRTTNWSNPATPGKAACRLAARAAGGLVSVTLLNVVRSIFDTITGFAKFVANTCEMYWVTTTGMFERIVAAFGVACVIISPG